MSDCWRLQPLTERELQRIELDYFRGLYKEDDVGLLISALHVHRKALRTLFSYFKTEPLRRVSTTDPIVNSELMYLKELVGMDRSSSAAL
jgi:hypothetical protein